MIDDEALLFADIGREGQCHTVIFVGVDTLAEVGLTALTIPIEFTTVHVVQHETQLSHLSLQRLYAIGLLDLQGRESCESEGDVLGGTGHYESLCQVWRVHKVIFQFWHAATILPDGNRLWHPLFLSLKRGLHAQKTEEVTYHRITLLRAVHQSCQSDFRIRVIVHGHHFIPIAGSAPVVLDEVVADRIGLCFHLDGIGRSPLCVCPKFAHGP